MSLRDLYQDVIVDHSKHPRNFHKLSQASSQGEGYNPLCGDKVVIYVKLDHGKVEDLSFEGSGCAISTASASLLTECLKSKKVSDVEVLFKKFHSLVTGEVAEELEKEPVLGKLAVFEGVQEFPARVKCATLAWHTLKSALKNNHEVVTTE